MSSSSDELLFRHNTGVQHAGNERFAHFSGAQDRDSFVLKHAVPFPVKRENSILRHPMLIGLTGRNAGGKGEVDEYLKKKSFYYYSLSDVIRDEIRSRGQEPTREALIQVGNELRQKYGAHILAERILSKVEDDKHYIIDSIRNPSEVDAFRGAKHFKLIRVEAPVEARFERIRARKRESDP